MHLRAAKKILSVGATKACSSLALIGAALDRSKIESMFKENSCNPPSGGIDITFIIMYISPFSEHYSGH